MFHKYNDGWIEVITGPMFSGKSAELIKRAETLMFANEDFLVFKPISDDRDKNIVKSRTGREIKSFVIEDPKEIWNYMNDNISAVIVDEVQFFPDSIIDVLHEVAKKGIRVIVAGLDMDFRMKPFSNMPQLLATSEFVTKLTAVCFSCGKAAAFSKRINGSDQIIDTETGSTKYEARCRRCHGVD